MGKQHNTHWPSESKLFYVTAHPIRVSLKTHTHVMQQAASFSSEPLPGTSSYETEVKVFTYCKTVFFQISSVNGKTEMFC